MPKTEQQLREQVCEIGRMMFQKGWIAGTDGNITVHKEENQILATPAGVCKGQLSPEDLIVCNLEGQKLHGTRQPTTEIEMHLTVYRLRPDVRAVVHAHPPTATGFAVAGRPLNLGVLPEVVLSLGSVPLAEYGLPGTPELVTGMLPYISKYDAMLLANHGAVAYADDLMKAFCRLDTVEHFAKITLTAELLGGARLLPRVEIQKLFDSRCRYGVQSRNSFEPGWPLAAEDLPGVANESQAVCEQIRSIDEAPKKRAAGGSDGGFWQAGNSKSMEG